MTNDPGKSPRFVISIEEVLGVVAFSSFWLAIFIQTFDRWRVFNKGLPPWFPLIESLNHPLFSWLFPFVFPVTITAFTASLIILLRGLLPHSIRAYFQWPRRPKVSPPAPEPILDSRPAVVAFAAACSAALLLIVAISNFRTDRTSGRPILIWEGPLASCMPYAALLGGSLSVLAIVIGFYAVRRCRSKLTPMARIAIGISFSGILVFLAAVCD